MSDQVQEAYVKRSTENSISTIEFFHPQSNSLPGKILNLLAEEITQAGQDKNASVIILKSGGAKAFCQELLLMN